MKNKKTHILWSPKKNYLGHWDLFEDKDLVLTIASGQWEDVKNPTTHKTEEKRVIRFKEKGYKPLICNQTNAKSILICTGVRMLEDLQGKDKQIALFISRTYSQIEKTDVDCIRIHSFLKPEELPPIKDLEQTLTWLKAKGNTMAGLKQIRTVTKEEEEELNTQLKSK